MRLPLLGFVLGMVMLAGGAHALRLTDGLYFTVSPNTTQEVYFILPDDLGAGPGKADYFVTTTTDWPVGLTKQTVTTEENNTAIIPVKFFSTDKKEGDCSNYTITISAPSLKLSRSWKGGVCLSKYADVDISKKTGDAKSVLNDNVDLFSSGFSTYTKSARPGKTIPVGIMVQSQASLVIDLTLDSRATLDQRAFVVQTNHSSEQQNFVVNVSAPTSGSYDVTLTAKARGCSIASCTKQSSMRLLVSASEPQDGFAISLFPQNLAIKSLEPVSYAFTLQNNYKDEKNFIVDVQVPLDMDSSLVLGNFTVPALSERTVNFTVTPKNQTGFYEIKVTASLDDVERFDSAYLSTNEMVSDVYRNADEAWAVANSSAKAAIDKNVKSWYSSYSKDEYGSDTASYSNLQNALDTAKKQNQSQPSQSENPGQAEVPESTEAQPNPLSWLLIPVLLGGVVFVIIMMFRRKQKVEDGEVLESI